MACRSISHCFSPVVTEERVLKRRCIRYPGDRVRRSWPRGQAKTHLLLVVQALVVILQSGQALLLAGFSLPGVDDVAAEHFLPEVEAAGRTCGGDALAADVRRADHGIGTAIPG